VNIKKLGRYALPYMIWLLALVGLPLIVMFFMTFFDTNGFDFSSFSFTLVQWKSLFIESNLNVFKVSLTYAFYTTLIAFALGYPIAYILAKSPFSNKLVILVLIIVPMWSNSLLRSTALANILSENNIVDDILSNFGLSFVWNIKGTGLAVILGLVLTYLPFMILPVYTVLDKMDPFLLEASADLGNNPTRTFLRVTFPMSLKGVMTGVIMVFLPSFSGFAIQNIMSGGRIIFIGDLINDSFTNWNYNFGSLLSMVVIMFIFGSIFLVNKFDKEGETLL